MAYIEEHSVLDLETGVETIVSRTEENKDDAATFVQTDEDVGTPAD